jgi:hypothetical protein
VPGVCEPVHSWRIIRRASLCVGGFGSAEFSSKPARCQRAFDRIGAFAIKALKRARIFAAWWQCESQICPAVRASWSLRLSHGRNFAANENGRQLKFGRPVPVAGLNPSGGSTAIRAAVRRLRRAWLRAKSRRRPLRHPSPFRHSWRLRSWKQFEPMQSLWTPKQGVRE